MSGDSALWPHASDETSGAPSSDRPSQRAEAIAMLALVIETRLTQRQREIVELYFFREKSQSEIATILGMSQQVVSKQLFGVMRKGRRVGGAIRRLEVLLGAQGIAFD